MIQPGWIETDLSALPEYCRLIAEATGVPLPANYPVVGADAFRTGTGVHAAAVIKAQKKGDAWLADRIYSGVPAGLVGRRQEIEIGHMSGRSNVIYWLESRGIEAEDALVDRNLDHPKRSDPTLTGAQIQALLEGAVYDSEGQLASGSYMDYTMPRADNVPSFKVETISVPSTLTRGVTLPSCHIRFARSGVMKWPLVNTWK